MIKELVPFPSLPFSPSKKVTATETSSKLHEHERGNDMTWSEPGGGGKEHQWSTWVLYYYYLLQRRFASLASSAPIHYSTRR
jgi:hypothetical protein